MMEEISSVSERGGRDGISSLGVGGGGGGAGVRTECYTNSHKCITLAAAAAAARMLVKHGGGEDDSGESHLCPTHEKQ